METTMERLAVMDEKRTEPGLPTARAGADRERLRALYVENQKRVFSVAVNFFGGDEASAKDVTQQVFLKIFDRLESFRGDAEFTTWLYRITINACLDERRRARRFLPFADFFGFGDSRGRRTPDEKIYRREIADEVQKAVAALKPKFRLPILLKYVEDLSYQEIAEVLECSAGTVASRLNRGHKMLADKLRHLKNEV